jgi:hypothetical protein
METQAIRDAFIRGMQKRAEELNLHKEAFIGPLLANAGRFFASPILGGMATNKALQFAMNQKKLPKLARGAKKWQDLLTSQGAKGQAANIATMMAGGAMVDPFLNPVWNMLEGQPKPEIPRSQFPEQYSNYY